MHRSAASHQSKYHNWVKLNGILSLAHFYSFAPISFHTHIHSRLIKNQTRCVMSFLRVINLVPFADRVTSKQTSRRFHRTKTIFFFKHRSTVVAFQDDAPWLYAVIIVNLDLLNAANNMKKTNSAKESEEVYRMKSNQFHA